MKFSTEKKGSFCRLVMGGKFTFADHDIFREIIGLIEDKEVTSVNMDLAAIEFVDSAALGMLLIARDKSEKNNVELVLSNPSGQIDKMFKVSKFDTLFTIK